MLSVVRQNGYALRYASDGLKADREVVLAAVRQNGKAEFYACKLLRNDREVVMEAVKSNEMALEFMEDKFSNDRDIFLEAANTILIKNKNKKYIGEALFLKAYAKKLADDKEVVLSFVRNNGRELEYASERLSADREVVLAAAAQNIDALKYAHEDLKNDKEFVVEAVRKHIYTFYNALGIVRQSPQEDRDVIVDKIAEFVGIPPHLKKLSKLDNNLADCAYALKRKKIDLNNARKALAKAQEYADKSPFFVKYKAAQAKKEAAEKAFEAAKATHESLQAAAKHLKKN